MSNRNRPFWKIEMYYLPPEKFVLMEVFPIFRPYIMAGVLARPTGMKGHLMNTIKRNLGLATVFASVMTTGWYFWVVKSRKDAYTNFYKNLDADAMFERQKSKGVFYYNKDMEEGEEE